MDSDSSTRAHELRALLVPFIKKRVELQDVDDVLQNVFVRIQRGIGELRESDKLVAWGYQIARNVIIDHMRRRAVRKHDALERARSVAAPREDDDSGARELSLILGHFIAMLPDPYRDALRWTELEGMTQADASKLAGISLSGMKSRVQRARSQLRELLERCCAIELDARGSIIEVEPTNPPADLPNCCARASFKSDVRLQNMTNTQQASNSDTTNTKKEEAGCCGGPAPTGADACCVKDAAAKAAGESGCGCGTKAASPAKKGCC